MKYYAGIGSRETPPQILRWMEWIGRRLEKGGYILRSGGARGADSAFERYVKNKEIFRPEGNIPAWCFEEVQKYIGPGKDFNRMKPYVQRLLARNMLQIFGTDGCHPVEFVICWTKDGKDTGGTGYAIRAAQANFIPIYNLYSENDKDGLRIILEAAR